MTSFIDDEGNELEYDGKDFAITKQAISFYNFKIKGNASINLKVSDSAKNRKILNYYGSDQINPTTRKTFNVIKDGNRIDRGQLNITNDDNNEIEFFFISGNASWFDLFSFNCNEIVTSKYNLMPPSDNSSPGWTNTDGIVFPIVDSCFNANLWPNHFNSDGLHVGSDSSAYPYTNSFTIQTLIPGLYVHTLVKLLANHAGCSVGGNIFSDAFFKRVFITPESMERWDTYDPNLDAAGNINKRMYKPEYIAPKSKAIDFMKWVCITFGAILTFDNDSNSISIDIIDKIDKADAEDWSQYYVSHEVQVDKYFDKYTITYRESDQQDIKDYNTHREQLYGDLLLDTGKDDGSTSPLFRAPFYPSYDKVGTSQLKWATPIVDYYTLNDEEEFAFTSVTNVGGLAQFNGSGNYPWGAASSTVGQIIRISSGIYAGYHYRDQSGTDTNARFLSRSTYMGNSTGSLFTQGLSKKNGHRVLVAAQSIPASSVMQYPVIRLGGSAAAGSQLTTITAGYFSKKITVYSVLNTFNQGLSYGEIDESERNDITLKEGYLRTFANIISNPPIRTKMLIPDSVFAKYNFEPIFLRLPRLNGYFLIEKIENYESGKTPVVTYIVKID